MALILAVVWLLNGCGTIDDKSPAGTDISTGEDTSTGGDVSTGNDTSQGGDAITGIDTSSEEGVGTTFKAEVIEGGDHLLVTPDVDSAEYRSSDRIAVALGSAVLENKDGNVITLVDLMPGDYLEITYGGEIAESYPAQIGAEKIKVTGHNVLMDGYLALIDDIWQEDAGLNGEIEMIAVDTTDWVGVSEIEKEIIFASMKEAYGYEIIEGTFDELVEKGLIDKDKLYFPKGVQIVIGDMKYDADRNKITCSIKKWRSGLGAIGSDDVTAQLKDDKWEITKNGMWIS